MDTFKINRLLVTVSRWCGYLLFFFVLLYFISGYGQSKHIIDRRLAKLLHEEWLVIPTFSVFLLHSLANFKLILLRKGVKDKTVWNICLIILGLALFVAFLYVYLK